MMIDVVGIGDKVVTLPDKDSVNFEALDDYYLIAKKIISTHAPKIRTGLADEMLNNDDAISNIAHAIMMADWKFDGRGNRLGYRKRMGEYAIKNYAARSGRVFRRQVFSLDNFINKMVESESFAQSLPDLSGGPGDNIERQEELDVLRERLEELLSCDLISDQQASYLRMYYLEGKSLSEIGKTRGVSKQGVSELIRKTCNILRQHIEDDQFFRGIIYED